MTKDRVDEIELALLREALQGPLDGRQKIVSMGLELVKAVHREREVRDSATAKSALALLWHGTSWTLLKEACRLLAALNMIARSDDAERFLKKVKDYAAA